MAEYVVPKRCEGFVMEDGTNYNANRSGRVHVDNPYHQAAIEKQSRIGGGHVHHSDHPLSDTKTTETKCHSCRFVGFGWQKICPKCGHEMVKE